MKLFALSLLIVALALVAQDLDEQIKRLDAKLDKAERAISEMEQHIGG